LILDFEFDQHLEYHKHVISIIMGFRDTGCYNIATSSRRVTLPSHGSKTSLLPPLHLLATLHLVAPLESKPKH
jgi:hypothetical protein